MFYSQFILAKKGPLGTIWIAAHLERKLKKNQVADTDIGVSVDSILSPEVPIALRLSSHLLLGVVRIYSRKVNYLFHDCSEALLKVKQAFRSAAVDLPPEESTAPYHSITLPETFDLDDFELPDSIIQGNFVDHHVSTREQITLQDSLDGMQYSTSQFGFGERFGDGDASQIHLDLEEVLFMDKNSSPHHASCQLSTEDGVVHRDHPSIPPTNMDVDEGQNGTVEHSIPKTRKDLSELLSNDCGNHTVSTVKNSKQNDNSSLHHGYSIRTPDLNELFLPDDQIGGSSLPDYTGCAAAPSPNLYECAEAPSTPRLMEEAIPASAQETPALSPQQNTSPSNAVETIYIGTSTIPHLEIASLDATKSDGPILGVSLNVESANNAQKVSYTNSILTEPKPLSIAPGNSCENLDVHDESYLGRSLKFDDYLQNGFICDQPNNLPIAHNNFESMLPEVGCLDGLVDSSCSRETFNMETQLEISPINTVEAVSSNDKMILSGKILDISSKLFGSKADQSIQDKELDDNLQNGFICDQPNNLPIAHDNFVSIFPEVACSDGLVESNCSRETSNMETQLEISPFNTVEAVSSNDKIILSGKTVDTSSNLFRSKADQSIQDNESNAACLHVPVPSSCSCETSKGETHLDKSPVDAVIPVSSNENILLSRLTLDIKNKLPESKADKSLQSDEVHADDMDSCPARNTSALRSNCSLKSCNIQLNQTNIMPSEAGALVEIPELCHREPGGISDATMTEQVLQASRYSVEAQGEHNLTAKIVEDIQEAHKKSELGLGKTDELPTGLISKATQLDTINCFASSKFAEPEKMLLGPTIGVNLSNHFRQATAERSPIESARDVDRISIPRGKKRHLVDTTTLPQIGSTARKTGLQHARRNTSYVPDDDDLLASILVGRTPDLRMGPAPPPLKIAARKRPRLMHRVGVPKRKVLLDDSIVLHVDAIRQQLMNTEDIRRIRKKAPCTRPEIWIIQKRLLAEEVFSETLLTGLSADLTCFDSQLYSLNEIPGVRKDGLLVDEHYSCVQPSKEMEDCRSSDFLGKSSMNEIVNPIITMQCEVDDEPSFAALSIEANGRTDDVEHDAREELESCPPLLKQPSNRQTGTVCTNTIESLAVPYIDIHGLETFGFEMPSLCAPLSLDECETVADSEIEVSLVEQTDKSGSPPEKGDSVCRQEQGPALELIRHSDKLSQTNEEDVNLTEYPSFEGPASAEDATRCKEVDRIALGVVADAALVQAEDAGTTENVLQEGSKGVLTTLNCHQEQGLVPKLVQSCGTLTEMVEPLEGTVNFTGHGSVEGIASVEDATRCTEDDRIAVEAVTNGTPIRAEDACITKGALQEGREGGVSDLNCTHYSNTDVGSIDNGETLISMLDNHLAEDADDFPADPAPVVGHANVSWSDMAIETGELTNLATTGGQHAMEETGEGRLRVTFEGEVTVQRVSANKERSTHDNSCSEKPETSCSYQANARAENVPSAAGESCPLRESNLDGGFNVEGTPMDFSAARESSDFSSVIVGNDTEFLNMDDEPDFHEEADNDVPDPEEAQLLENSGWSSRTRGVARYLKTLFDEDLGHGRKVVAMDHLLAGKTRKEASRMFFEMLVLKTKDYVHAEQEHPFDCINIKPRPKLLKSDF